jgi:hypothetical protein
METSISENTKIEMPIPTQMTFIPPERIKRRDLGYIGANGRVKDVNLAGERIKKWWGHIIGASLILDWEFIAGEETHKIPRHGKKWDEEKNRHDGGSIGKAGLQIYLYNKLEPWKGGHVYVWIRPYRNNQDYPVYNIPSDICKKEEVKENGYAQLENLFIRKNLWYIVLRCNNDETIKEYTIGQYKNFPRESYNTWNKDGKQHQKHNSVNFPHVPMQWDEMGDSKKFITKCDMIFG